MLTGLSDFQKDFNLTNTDLIWWKAWQFLFIVMTCDSADNEIHDIFFYIIRRKVLIHTIHVFCSPYIFSVHMQSLKRLQYKSFSYQFLWMVLEVAAFNKSPANISLTLLQIFDWFKKYQFCRFYIGNQTKIKIYH